MDHRRSSQQLLAFAWLWSPWRSDLEKHMTTELRDCMASQFPRSDALCPLPPAGLSLMVHAKARRFIIYTNLGLNHMLFVVRYAQRCLYL